MMLAKKKCMKCGQPATHKFTRIDKGQVVDFFLCAEHAAEMSPYQKPKIPLSDILEGLFKQETRQKGSAPTGVRCQTCGLTFEAYKKNLLLGCSDCYTAFREYLVPDLRRFHGDTRHYGRKPGGGLARPAPREFFLAEIEGESAAPAPKSETAPGPESEPALDYTVLIDELTREMREAIENENFSRAARCRDQIRELKAKMKSAPSGE